MDSQTPVVHRTPAANLVLRAMHTRVFFWLAYILTLAHSVGGSVWRIGGIISVLFVFEKLCLQWFFYPRFFINSVDFLLSSLSPPPYWHRRCHPWNINQYHFLCDLSCLQVSWLYWPVLRLHFVNSVRNPLFTEKVVYSIVDWNSRLDLSLF